MHDPGGKKSGDGSGVEKVGRELGLFERLYLPAIAGGMSTTIRHFVRNVFTRKQSYISTVQYPDQKVEYPERFRGMHRLVQREDGSPRCVACFMCETACPARCIHIVAGETDPSIEKFPVVFEIDELRCVVCGLCVEACPCDAIRMDTGIHPRPIYTREEAVFGKNDLLAIPGRDQTLAPKNEAPPPTDQGTGRIDRAKGDLGAGGSKGGFEF